MTDDQHRPALPGDVPTPAVTVDALTAAVNGLIARQLDAVLRLQGDLATTGALCVLDDLQWIDDRTLAVVQQALDGPGDGPGVALLATARTGERLGDAALGLRRAAGATTVPLAPLDDDEVADLATAVLGAPPDRSLRRALCTATGGNPLFVVELLEATDERAVLRVVRSFGASRVEQRLRLEVVAQLMFPTFLFDIDTTVVSGVHF